MTAARKLPAPPPQPVQSAREFLAEGYKRVNAQSLLAADQEYGDDFEREPADLQAAGHSLAGVLSSR